MKDGENTEMKEEYSYEIRMTKLATLRICCNCFHASFIRPKNYTYEKDIFILDGDRVDY